MSWLPVGEVSLLHRFSVKSMLGETLDVLEFDERGAVADRLWAVKYPDGKYGAGKNTPRFRTTNALRECTAVYDGSIPHITFPNGMTLRGDDPAVHTALSELIGQPVELAREEQVPLTDTWPGRIHILTTTAIDYVRKLLPESDVDERRFRPTLLITMDGAPEPVEETWIGRTVSAGPVNFEVIERTERCVMINHERDGLPRDSKVLKSLAENNDMMLGVYAQVTVPGRIRVGDKVYVT